MISVIIPSYNEQETIVTLIALLQKRSTQVAEIIVADGGSTDLTQVTATDAGAKVISCGVKGRAAQMNAGACVAQSEVLYFLHADSFPPSNFDRQILDALKTGVKCGCFRLKFDEPHWFLRANAWFTRFDINAFRFGDQSLFAVREIFHKSGGFNEDLLMMEDQEIIHRLKKLGRFKVVNDWVTTSARTYRENGIYRLQGIFFRIWAMYYLGYSQQEMLRTYQRLVKKSKL